MSDIDWHFDLLSPFARIAHPVMSCLASEGHGVRARATLLGAMLKHWGQLGPAEVEPKRVHTYRLAIHVAKRNGLALRFPPVHPFNPLPAMRLLAGMNAGAGATLEQAGTALAFVWDEGRAPSTEPELAALAERLGADPDLAVSEGSKAALREATDDAIARGVFGVPTAVVAREGAENGHDVFWGVDALPMLREYLDDPGMMERDGMGDLDRVEYGVRRR